LIAPWRVVVVLVGIDVVAAVDIVVFIGDLLGGKSMAVARLCCLSVPARQ
jgi:hypothetical protein